MRIAHFFVLLLIVLYSKSAYSQLSAEDILRKSYSSIHSKKSVAYDAQYRKKLLNGTDTLMYHSKVYLQRNEKDSILNGLVWFTVGDSAVKFYDLHQIFFVKNGAKEVTTYNPHLGQLSTITGSIPSEVIWRSFLSPERLKKLNDKNNVLKKLNDTAIDDKPCFQLAAFIPDQGAFTQQWSLLCIEKTNFIPILQSRCVTFQGNTEYSELYLKTFAFDTVSAARFSKKQIPAAYKITPYKSKTMTSKSFIGQPASQIAGKKYLSDNLTDTVLFKGKVTLLDFWYMSCLPCIKAIPMVETLVSKYDPATFQVIGINCFDNDTSRLKKIPQFLKFNQINYPIFFTDKKVISDYEIVGWPSFFVVDTTGKIAFNVTGFGDSVYKQLDSIIDKLKR